MNRRDGGWEKTNRGERVDREDAAICERVSQIPRRDQKDKTSDVIKYRDARLVTDAQMPRHCGGLGRQLTTCRGSKHVAGDLETRTYAANHCTINYAHSID